MVRPRTWKLNLRASFLLEFSQRLSTMANERLVVLVRDDDTNDHPLAQVGDDALELGRNLLDEFLLATNDDLIVGWLWAEKDGQYLSLMRELRPADVQSHKPGLFPRVRWSSNARKEVLQPNATATNDSSMELGLNFDGNHRLILD